MAPRKTAAAAKKAPAVKMSEVKKSEDKVVKRPARGFHKFRNGMLNVTPKGAEKELAKNNQQSPLLRLPGELRNDIWKLVLGGKVYRSEYAGPRKARLRSSPNEPKNAMALLRTCRQIYAESALVPLMSTMFSFRYVDHAGRVLRMFKAHQRKHITTIEFQMFHPNHDYSLCEGTFLNSRVSLPKLLPGLKELHVRVFCVPSLEENDTQKTEAKLQQLLNPQVEGMEVDIKVEETQLTPHEYYKEWHPKVPENGEQTQGEDPIAAKEDPIVAKEDPIAEEDDFIAKEDDDFIIADEEDSIAV